MCRESSPPGSPRGIAYLQGTARLGANRTVHVTSPDGVEHELAACTVLVAPGSHPTHYPVIPFDDPDVYDSDQIYSIKTVPKDIVVDGGPIGVEFATVFSALGIPAMLVSQSDRLLAAIDPLREEPTARTTRLLPANCANFRAF